MPDRKARRKKMKRDGNVKIGKWGKKRPLGSFFPTTFLEQPNKMLYPFRLNHQLDAMKRRKHERQFAGSDPHSAVLSERDTSMRPSRVERLILTNSIWIPFKWDVPNIINQTKSIYVCRSHPMNDDKRRLCWWCCLSCRCHNKSKSLKFMVSWFRFEDALISFA